MASLVLFAFFFSSPAFGSTQSMPVQLQEMAEQSQVQARETVPPAEKKVVQPESASPSANDFVVLFVVNTALLGLVALVFWFVLFRASANGLPLLALNKRLLKAGIAMMLTGPILGSIEPYQTLWLPIGMNILFALGWVLTGATFRPRKSYSRGALLAAITYLIGGLIWVFSFSIVIGESTEKILTQDLFGLILVSIFWPIHMAAWLGLFGLSFR